MFDYSLRAEAESACMQAWVLRAPRRTELSLAPRYDGPKLDVPYPPHPTTSGETVVVNSLSTTVPGCCRTPADYWTLVLTGTDPVQEIPLLRWDLSIYHDPDGGPAKHYTKHMGLTPTTTWTEFDNEFFGIPVEQARQIDMCQRSTLEVAYDTLHRAGFTRETLHGAELAVGIGSGPSDLANEMKTGLTSPIGAGVMVNTTGASFSNRLHYMFNITGPALFVETACSSSLTATACVHSMLRPVERGGWDRLAGAASQRMQQGLVLGCAAQLSPSFTIGLCSAGMISHTGRCFTFDHSADGFIRAEGVLGAFTKVCSSEDPLSYAILSGSSCNQDGRSASLTAPHGPSQQECIRQSMGEAGITPADVRIQELHGTGTALGDPIEVGALRATLMSHNKKVREHPLVNTSSKSNFGHMELSAGLGGFAKCVLMGVHAVGAPNVHLRDLNAHLDTAGYPVAFDSEVLDQARPDAYCGVSSFGFSGCNARGDIWARALLGLHKAGDLDWTSKRFLKECEDFRNSYVTWSDKDFESKLTGTYLLGSPANEFQDFYIMTSANCWNALTQMFPQNDASNGKMFIGVLRLGDTRIEYFRLCAGGFSDCQLGPASMQGSPSDMVIGPGPERPGYNWVVDCRDDPDCPSGTIMRVDFWWDSMLKQKKVSWRRASEEEAAFSAPNLAPVTHSYYICGSWTSWGPIWMAPVRGKPGHYQLKLRMGSSGHEEFHIQRDKDRWQGIYPSVGGAGRTTAAVVPIRGPDGKGKGKHWTLEGSPGESFIITLQVSEGQMVLSVRYHGGETRWTNLSGADRQAYSLAGTWNEEPVPMRPCGGRKHEATVKLLREEEEFQILVDRDPRQAFYPEMPMASPGATNVCGPDSGGRGLSWLIYGSPGDEMLITLDLDKDKREMVTWAALPLLHLRNEIEE